LLRAFPDFEKIPVTAGRSDWSMVQFDIDAAGKPISLRTYGTTGNKALDKASLKAVAQSRFTTGAKRGCIYPYWRRGDTLAAPEGKEIAAYRSEDSDCPQPVEWKSQPTLMYPENFRRRGIEGWAVIAFDLAPWGAVGNAKVVAAEPAAEFGEAAQRIVLGSAAASSKKGYSNCVVRVRYAMQEQERAAQMNVD
jgi:TonB family protein